MKNISSYFLNALIAYIETGEIEVKVALITSIAVSSENLLKLRNIKEEIYNNIKSTTKNVETSEIVEYKDHVKDLYIRFEEVEEALSKKWETEDIENQKRILQETNIHYYKSLENGNSDIFINQYPNIFK